VAISWGPGTLHGLDTEKLAGALRAHAGRGGSITDRGDADAALAQSEVKIGGTYEAPYLAHAPIEPNNGIARVVGDTAEVWGPTQSPTITQVFVADALGIGMDDVKVNVTLLGGSFGRRMGDACAQAAQIAQRVKRPVKLIWTRESEMTQGWYRPIYSAKVEGAVRGGKVTGAKVRVLSHSIAASSGALFGAALSQLPGPLARSVTRAALAVFSTNSFGDVNATEGISDTPYQFGNFALAAEPVKTQLPVGFWRSVGHSVTGFIVEGLVDELAVAANQDPFALRRALLAPRSSQTRVLDRLEQLSGWSTPPVSGIGRGLARHQTYGTEVAQVAEVELVDGRIRVRKVYCVVDCGIAVNPDIVRAQMEGAIIFGLSAALDQQITVVDGVVQQRNFDTFPVLRMHETPEIVIDILASDEPPTGVGEPGVPPIAPAVANAMFRLTGVRLRRMPLQRAWNERGVS
jgi:CO/xanthine dehydrogenase Mo-binding subunit